MAFNFSTGEQSNLASVTVMAGVALRDRCLRLWIDVELKEKIKVCYIIKDGNCHKKLE